MDFNPHHHAGGDEGVWDSGPVNDISIHTTTQVVTDEEKKSPLELEISIHTTTQVVTISNIENFQ